ncbi:MAG: choice-of-anchor D domain-containing protein, partial [Bryobacteraceae bacterium]|nr:choice-of-anchor D domain-containing protein [Bryobacteraceae bacterium]
MTRRILALSSLLLAAVPTSFGQAPFTLLIQQGTNRYTIPDGGTVTLSADGIGLAAWASVTMTYTGTAGPVSINALELTGHTDLSVAGLPELPVSLMRNQSIIFQVRYLPSSGQRITGRLHMNYAEGRTTGAITINLVGTAPEFAFSYVPPGGNATPVAAGGTVTFPATALNSTATATFVITNRGSGAGLVNSIRAAGDAFQLAGLPLPPVTVEAGKELRFSVQFTPKQLAASFGSLEIEVADRRVHFRLEGTGSGPVWMYEVLLPTGAMTIAPNQAISMP